MGDFMGWLMVAVIGTVFIGFAIGVVSSIAQDMSERGTPRWMRWLVLVLTFVPPGVVWGLALWMYDQKRHPPRADGGSGWMGAFRRWTNRRREDGSSATPSGESAP